METSKLIKLNLPEFVFLDGSPHEKGHNLDQRTVIMHVRSATVLEIFNKEDVFLKDDVLAIEFTHTSKVYGVKEDLVCAVHFSATLDIKKDQDLIVNKIVRKACNWYEKYADFEDASIEREDKILYQ